MRLFVAVAPPAAQRREIALAVEQSWGDGPGRVVPPENLHLTLAFLGEVAAERLRELEAALESVRTHPAFELGWGGLEAFPSLARARVAVLGTREGGPQITSLARALRGSLPPDLRPEEGRPFRPHLTVARFRQPPPRPRLERLREELAPLSWSSRVTQVRLIRSRLEASGARYESLREQALEGS